MKIVRSLLRVSLALTAVFFAGLVGLWFFGPPACGNDFVEAIPSPDGSKKIVVFQRSCGATTGFSTQASLLPATEALANSSGNVFSSDTNHGAAPSGPGGGPALQVAWQSSGAVAISYHPAVRVFKAEQQVGGVQFFYPVAQHAAQQGAPADRP